ncbi:MAG TPA: dipeptidase PepE [Thermoanaerobaculia bacterium]|nr:dipeptidase PepE [Thermoanaerobaculia bacterium]
MMRLLLISSSTVHGYGYLDHPEPEIRSFLGERKRVAFVPFALHDHDGYAAKVRERLGLMGFDVEQVRGPSDIEGAEAVFVGGGNTFRLLKTLYETKVFDAVRAAVRGGIAYMGSSAGSNVAGPTIKTTNDMPIVYPPTFDAFGFVPFQINPHYLDADPGSTHMGETREQRIVEFLEENDTPVVAIREGSAIRVEGGTVSLAGSRPARVFRRGAEPREVEPGVIPSFGEESGPSGGRSRSRPG